MSSRAAFDQTIATLARYYSKTEAFSDDFIQATWADSLRVLTDQELAIATKLCIQKHRFLPTPEEFVELITGPIELVAQEEWQKILNWTQSYGGLRGIGKNLPSLILSDQGELSLRKLGGISFLANDNNPHRLQKEFIKDWLNYKHALAIGQIEPPPPLLQSAPKPEPPPVEENRDPLAFNTAIESLKETHPSLYEAFKRGQQENPATKPEDRNPLTSGQLEQRRKERKQIYAESHTTFLSIAQH